MSKTTAIPMDKEIQSFQFISTGQQYFEKIPPRSPILQGFGKDIYAILSFTGQQ